VSFAATGLMIGVQLLAICGCGGSGARRPIVMSRSTLTWLGSTQSIVSTRVPGGPAFSIVGQRYRFWGDTHLQIATRFAEPWQVADAGRESTWGNEDASGKSNLFEEELQVTAGCQVRPFAIVRGLLKQSADAVLARVAGRVVHLSEVALPASLGSRAVLVYGATPTAPSEFAVRTHAGKLVRLSRLGQGRSVPEGCAGQEREWVQAHFGSAVAGVVLARIAECLRRHGFEVGAPDEELPFELGRRGARKWRQFDAAQRLCRTQVSANTRPSSSIWNSLVADILSHVSVSRRYASIAGSASPSVRSSSEPPCACGPDGNPQSGRSTPPGVHPPSSHRIRTLHTLSHDPWTPVEKPTPNLPQHLMARSRRESKLRDERNGVT
jgi:hypothetical protein